ncbi:MAG: NosD domain-containing protein [Negativicutes bacterium]|nr:NosD domain-containing protein [Negativicutes bacterium]
MRNIRKRMNWVVLCGILLAAACGGANAEAKTISVSGTSIQAAINAAVSGDVIVVNAGTYKEQLSIVSKSGITLQASGAVLIDGTGMKVPSGDSQMVLIKNSANITFQGFEVANYVTSSSSAFNKGIMVTGSGSYIKILGNKVHNIVNTNANGGAHGIAAYGTNSTSSINNLVIDSNEVYGLKTGWSESVVLNGNVERFAVTNNHVHDNNNIGIDFIGWEGTATGAVDRARNGVCSGNYVHNISSKTNPSYGGDKCADGIYVDGGTQITISNNRVEYCDIGIELGSEHKGKDTSYITVTGNTDRCNITGLYLGGYDSKRGQTNNCTIQNNIIQANTGEQVCFQYYCYNNILTNNTISKVNAISYVKASTCSGNVTSPNTLL